jgi:SPP1 gp7 family putative phage head morphogenesis protein
MALNPAKLLSFKPQGVSEEVLASLTGDVMIEGARSSEWWAKQNIDLKQKFARTVNLSVMNGEPATRTAARITGGVVDGERINGFMNVSRRNARTLARQSTAQVASEARKLSFRNNADVIRGYQQISTFDQRTTEICMAYSGAAWDLEGEPIDGTVLPFNGGPPRHYNCRSVLVPVLRAWDEMGLAGPKLSAGTRASLNGQVAADLSFDQWLMKQSASIQNQLLGKAKAEAFRAGNLSVKQLVSMTGEPVAASVALAAAEAAATAQTATSAQLSKVATLQAKAFQVIDDIPMPPQSYAALVNGDGIKVANAESLLKLVLEVDSEQAKALMQAWRASKQKQDKPKPSAASSAVSAIPTRPGAQAVPLSADEIEDALKFVSRTPEFASLNAPDYRRAASTTVKYDAQLKMKPTATSRLSDPEIFVVHNYTTGDYAKINNALRGVDRNRNLLPAAEAAKVRAEVANYARLLNNALDKLPAYKGTVYRTAGAHGDLSSTDILMRYNVGEVLEEAGFTSTTHKAMSGVGSTQYKLVIKSKGGRVIDAVSRYTEEYEVLFKAGTRFRVVKKDMNKRTVWLEEVEGGP